MQEALINLIIIYVSAILLFIILLSIVSKIIKKPAAKIIYVITLLLPLLLYIPVELNTYLYGNDFKDLKFDTGFNSKVIYYKIFYIDDTKAKVLYIEGENGVHKEANFYMFVKENGKWKYESWIETIWTNEGGSASKTTFPPYS